MTGGAGFVGSHLVDRLLDDGADVLVLDSMAGGRCDNLARHRGASRLRFVCGDVRDAPTVQAALSGASVVYHLAAQPRVAGAFGDVDDRFTTNVVGTFNVLRAASQAHVRRVVFTSSCAVYGQAIDLPVDEGQPLQAISHYGASKVAGEAYCRAFRRTSGLHSVVLRLASVYGPRDDGRVIPTWLARARARQQLDVYGGRQILDFVPVGVVVEALVRAARVAAPVPAINVGSGTATPLLDVARKILRLTGGHSQLAVLPERPVDITRFVANVDRLRELLGVNPPDDPLAELRSLVEDGATTSTGTGGSTGPARR